MKKDFITPPAHVGFEAKKLFGNMSGEIKDGSIAYLAPGGGGPLEKHTHSHDHLFIVAKGEAVVHYADHDVIIHCNESLLVKGSEPHSVWNNTDSETIMIGVTIQ